MCTIVSKATSELLAAKYGGKMNIKAEDGVFSVSILFSGINQNDEATE